MRNKGQIKDLEKMIRKVEKKGNITFLSKDYESTFGYIGTMNFGTMRKLGYLDVVSVEYYDVPVSGTEEQAFAVKGSEKFKINDNWSEKKVAEKLGFEIVYEESECEPIKGKRYTYQFNLDKMKKDYNSSVKDYGRFKREQAQRLVDKLSTKVEDLSRRLTLAENQLCSTVDKVNNTDFSGGLQLMV